MTRRYPYDKIIMRGSNDANALSTFPEREYNILLFRFLV